LAGAGFAATEANGNPEPILLTLSPTSLGTFVPTFLNAGGSPAGFTFDSAGSHLTTINVLGGPDSVAATTLDSALEDIITG
jgi:hypothetical protein